MSLRIGVDPHIQIEFRIADLYDAFQIPAFEGGIKSQRIFRIIRMHTYEGVGLVQVFIF